MDSISRISDAYKRIVNKGMSVDERVENESETLQTVINSTDDNEGNSIKELIDNKSSIYNEIVQNQKDGVLPREYRLFKKDSNMPNYIKGSLDSVNIYHMQRKKITSVENEAMYNIVLHASKGIYNTAYEMLSEFMSNHMAIAIIDALQTIIARSKNIFCMENIFHFATILVTKSDNIECVKVGLIIFELYDFSNQLKEVVRTVSQSEEFTMFGAYIISRWENGNEELMSLADKVSGWGKIHIVRIIDPSNENIKQWLLKEGIRNDISPTYSAHDCYKKLDIPNMLKKNKLGAVEFELICEIVNELFNEDRLPGISTIDNAGEMLKDVLVHAKYQDNVSRRTLVILYNVEKWLEKADML